VQRQTGVDEGGLSGDDASIEKDFWFKKVRTGGQKLPNRKERKACANQALRCEPLGLFFATFAVKDLGQLIDYFGSGSV
jgi:hypothetical protein